MTSTANDPALTSEPRLNVHASDEALRALEVVAGYEGRPVSSVLDDAVKFYIRSHSEGYRAYLDLAHRYSKAPEGSEEKALAGAELSAAMAREQGRTPLERGGDPLAVRARLRRRALSSNTDNL